MSTVIQIKRSSGTTAPATLKLGELAYTYGTGTQGNFGDRLFIGTGGVDINGDALYEDIIGGKYFTQKLDHVDGTLTASSALTADANLAINTINIGNALSTGGEIRFNEGTNNGTAYIGLKAPNDVSGAGGSQTYTLPGSDGSAGQFLKTDGNGILSFETVNQFITLSDGTDTDQYNTSETLLFTGGQSITTAVTDNEITFSVTAQSIDTGQLTDGAVTNVKIDDPTITLGSSTLTLGATTTDIAGLTSLVVDDITVNGQSITTTASNKDIVLTPHGTGTITVPSGYEERAGFTDNSLANKKYVDTVAQGLDIKDAVRVATTAALTVTYSNGTSGVGATLTNAGSQAAISIDGVTLSLNDRVLVKDQSSAIQNGIYKVTTVGDGSTNWVLTRTPDGDESSEINGGSFFFVQEGTDNSDNGYVATHNGAPTIGSDNITFEQFSGAGQITAGSALTKTGNQLDVAVDNSSIEITADALNVKALGITNDMLAGSIASSKLADPLYFTDESSTQGNVNLGGTLEFLAGEGINTVALGRTLTISGELASTSNIGVASFNSSNFAVSSGDVTVTTIDGGSF